MTRLTRVELRRMLTRRLVQVAMVIMLAIVGLSLFGVFDATRDLGGQRAEAMQHFEQAQEDWELNGEQMVEQCLESEEVEREASGDPNLDFGCESMQEPRLEDFLPGPQSLARQYQELLSTIAYPILFLALIMGATATAAEFSTRTIGTWLTFEPRRTRVFGSKTLAGGLGTVPMSLVFVALILLGTAAVYRFNGVDDDVSAHEWSDLAWMGGRIVLLVTIVGALGAATGMLLRHTAAVLGVLIGYLAVGELVMRSLFPGLERYLLSRNIDAWVNDGTEWVTYDCDDAMMTCRETVNTLSLTQGATTIGVISVAVLLLSWLVFRGSDID